MLVKIDRSTIRKNPNAGNTVYYRNIGPAEYYKTTVERIENQWVKTDYSGREENGEIVYNINRIQSYGCKNNPFDFLGVKEWSHQPYERIYSLYPEPEYLFSYENPLIKCEYCEAEFPISELVNDFCDYGGYNDRVCPKCSVWDCCEIEYEVFDPKSINEKSPME